MQEFFGYIGALLIGIVLGMAGGGGSILTVPVLVYLFGIKPVAATAYSLFIVGTTSAFGSILNYKKGLVDIRTGTRYAIPSVAAIFLTRKFLVPAIPENLFSIGSIFVTKELFIMFLFAIVMMLASFSMLGAKRNAAAKEEANAAVAGVKIFFIGIVIGLVGAGGGFLIIPALVFAAGLPMKKAVGTSIFIIAVNSLIGFAGDISHFDPDWPFLLLFSFISILGIFAGIYLGRFINEKSLKKGFGWFVLAMSVFILIKEAYTRF